MVLLLLALLFSKVYWQDYRPLINSLELPFELPFSNPFDNPLYYPFDIFIQLPIGLLSQQPSTSHWTCLEIVKRFVPRPPLLERPMQWYRDAQDSDRIRDAELVIGGIKYLTHICDTQHHPN